MESIGLLLAELLVVFLGVSLSFLVENRRERRTERREAHRALAGITEDLAVEIPNVEWLAGVYGPTAAAAEKLYLEWHDLPETSEPPESVLRRIHMGAPYAPARANYEAAKVSGGLGQIEDRDLQSAIIAVFEQQQDFLRSLHRITLEFDFEFIRRLRPYISYGPLTNTFEQQTIPGEGTLIGEIAFLPEGALQLRVDEATRNNLYIMALFRRHFSVQLQKQLVTMRELQQRLQHALAAAGVPARTE
ncbi:MAG: hypothetical protein ACRELD_01665 [Longimicrobiales bacterium]